MSDGIERAGTTVVVAHVDTQDIVDEGRARTKWLGNGLKRRDWNQGFGQVGTADATAQRQRGQQCKESHGYSQ